MGEQTGLDIIAGARFFLAGIMAVVMEILVPTSAFPKENVLVADPASEFFTDDSAIFFLLYRPGKDQWRQGIHYRGFECLCGIVCGMPSF